MVDCGEKVSTTVKREFMEEAMNGLEKSAEDKQKTVKQLENLFNQDVFVSFLKKNNLNYSFNFANFFQIKRFIKVMLTILVIRITHGWKQLRLIFTMKLIKFLARLNLKLVRYKLVLNKHYYYTYKFNL